MIKIRKKKKNLCWDFEFQKKKKFTKLKFDFTYYFKHSYT